MHPGLVDRKYAVKLRLVLVVECFRGYVGLYRPIIPEIRGNTYRRWYLLTSPREATLLVNITAGRTREAPHYCRVAVSDRLAQLAMVGTALAINSNHSFILGGAQHCIETLKLNIADCCTFVDFKCWQCRGSALHLFCLSSWNVEEDNSLALLTLLSILPVTKTFVNPVISSTLQLNHIILLQSLGIGSAPRWLHKLSYRRQELLEVVILLKLVFGDEIVKVPKLRRDELLALV